MFAKSGWIGLGLAVLFLGATGCAAAGGDDEEAATDEGAMTATVSERSPAGHYDLETGDDATSLDTTGKPYTFLPTPGASDLYLDSEDNFSIRQFYAYKNSDPKKTPVKIGVHGEWSRKGDSIVVTTSSDPVLVADAEFAETGWFGKKPDAKRLPSPKEIVFEHILTASRQSLRGPNETWSRSALPRRKK